MEKIEQLNGVLSPAESRDPVDDPFAATEGLQLELTGCCHHHSSDDDKTTSIDPGRSENGAGKILLFRGRPLPSAATASSVLDRFDTVPRFEQHHFGRVVCSKGLSHWRIGADDKQVADVGLAGRSPIEGNRS